MRAIVQDRYGAPDDVLELKNIDMPVVGDDEVLALVQGVEGQKVWQHPLIERDLLATIHDVTGVQVSMPAVDNS